MGVDGSDASQEALRWAAEEARLRSAPLVAVHAWSFVPPQPIGDPGMLAMPAGDLPGQLSAESDAARIALDSAVEDVLGADAEVERKLVEGDAGEALVAESEIGAARRGRLARPLGVQGGPARLGEPSRRQPRGVPRGRRQDLAERRGRLVFSARSRSRSVTPPAVCVHQRTVTFR